MSLATTDLADAHADVQVCEPLFGDYGGRLAFHGAIRTLKVFEDNVLVRSELETPGGGRVLVVDGGGSLRCALVGGKLAQLGVNNGWAGILVYGCVRDSEELAAADIGVKALATHPRRTEKGLHSGHTGRPVEFAGVVFRDGDWLYADADGVIVADRALHSGG